jgi:hypothetical protein
MSTRSRNSKGSCEGPLPALRFEIPEAARILRMSRAQLYNRIGEGLIRAQKDGARTYITRTELEQYVQSCDSSLHSPGPLSSSASGGSANETPSPSTGENLHGAPSTPGS